MSYRVQIMYRAQRDIDAFSRYCREHSPAFWVEQEERLSRVFETWLADAPHTWGFFFVTGAPYRGYLFGVGERTKYWLVYRINEQSSTVYVMRMWSAARNPKNFRV